MRQLLKRGLLISFLLIIFPELGVSRDVRSTTGNLMVKVMPKQINGEPHIGFRECNIDSFDNLLDCRVLGARDFYSANFLDEQQGKELRDALVTSGLLLVGTLSGAYVGWWAAGYLTHIIGSAFVAYFGGAVVGAYIPTGVLKFARKIKTKLLDPIDPFEQWGQLEVIANEVLNDSLIVVGEDNQSVEEYIDRLELILTKVDNSIANANF